MVAEHGGNVNTACLTHRLFERFRAGFAPAARTLPRVRIPNGAWKVRERAV
jgi:predicted RNase H-like nuclease